MRAAAQRIVATVVWTSALVCAEDEGSISVADCDGADDVEKELRMRCVGRGRLIGAAGRNRLKDIEAAGDIDIVDVGPPESDLRRESPTPEALSSGLNCDA
jgi:hypothetical protein